ncbi:Molecular chaperone IbpA, HSP20 family [Ectothiorhodospira mobilis]|uniref:Molecular chaperone IbpA, HSP20 family n=1 Tax=Ectothiorhodospira mobilis TaxID=195064 RepID=A0A1I4PFY4_ECTMO|nr:Hsp20/alpha crystallin family protein [Ectothiorhodospira mobilis]SFM26323.1 Molecular chaperone IbpA, HSP20 family [Ectothiorhodospira mobilis]
MSQQAQQQMSPREERGMQQQQAARSREWVMQPPVDIHENGTGITLVADMPGVSKDRLEVEVENDVLTIEGEVSIPMPEEMKALYADLRSKRYRRSFTLSRELDLDQIRATMKDGVLTLHIPKRAEFQPRRIQVNVN